MRLKLTAPVVCGRIACAPYSVAPQLRRNPLGSRNQPFSLTTKFLLDETRRHLRARSGRQDGGWLGPPTPHGATLVPQPHGCRLGAAVLYFRHASVLTAGFDHSNTCVRGGR